MSLINGIHHVSMKCCDDKKYNEVINFYKDILLIPVVREWDKGVMFDTGDGIIEIFNDGDIDLDKGTIRHFAFATNDVDGCVDSVRKAGYEVLIEPKNIEIPSSPILSARIAFCKGPLGEEIEFFDEKSDFSEEESN